MLVVYLLISLFYATEQYQDLMLPQPQPQNQKNIKCVIGILDEYFSNRKEFTIVNMSPYNDELLRVIYSTMRFSVISRESTKQMFVANQGYLVLFPDVNTFSQYFEHLIREPMWNPYARFLIVIELLQVIELAQIFDCLLRQHVNNVLVVNGTKDAHLYTYNPFDNFACGRYYNTIISYGQCLQANHDLYPNKLVTGLKNCTFRGSLAHRPPFSINPLKNEYRNKLPGMEQVILKLVSESDEFEVNFEFNYKSASFPIIAANMTAIGPLDLLQKNETDVIFGAMMVTASRGEAFSYLCGYHDYVDELRFAVRKASFVPNWKNVYLEFDVIVWVLLLVNLIVYSIIMSHLLETKDKVKVMLALLDNLVLHGRDISSPMNVKCILLMWIWFAYLINIFYQSSLFSLTMNPSKEYQISDEKDMVKYNLQPCLNSGLAMYIYTENSKKHYNKSKTRNMDCENVIKGLDLVSNSRDIFTLLPSYFYSYNKQTYNNKYGESLIYYFEKPYAKILLGYYFYKGFPISLRLRTNMMRMRESGIALKNLRDQYFMRSIKYNFITKEFENRFVFPWCVYVVGCFMATISFIIERMMYVKWHRFGCRKCKSSV